MYKTADGNWEVAQEQDIPPSDLMAPRAKCLRCGVRLITSDDSMSIHSDWHEQLSRLLPGNPSVPS